MNLMYGWGGEVNTAPINILDRWQIGIPGYPGHSYFRNMFVVLFCFLIVFYLLFVDVCGGGGAFKRF